MRQCLHQSGDLSSLRWRNCRRGAIRVVGVWTVALGRAAPTGRSPMFITQPYRTKERDADLPGAASNPAEALEFPTLEKEFSRRSRTVSNGLLTVPAKIVHSETKSGVTGDDASARKRRTKSRRYLLPDARATSAHAVLMLAQIANCDRRAATFGRLLEPHQGGVCHCATLAVRGRRAR